MELTELMSSLGVVPDEEAIEQDGVKGMKWGIRKDRPGPEVVLTKELKDGGTLQVVRDPKGRFVDGLSRLSPKYATFAAKVHSFTLKDADGKKVGDASFFQDSPTSLSLDWIGVPPKHRGKGYASAALQGVVNYAKDNGIDTLKLEVPGNAPDARHIYEKLGFKDDPDQTVYNDPYWGGLTVMTLKVPTDNVVRHSDIDVAMIMDYIGKALDNEPTEDNVPDQTEFLAQATDSSFSELVSSLGIVPDEEALEQAGVKGMKWGVRKSDNAGGQALGKPKSLSSTFAKKPDPVRDARSAAASNRRTMSDKEIDQLVNRLTKEKRLKELLDADLKPGRTETKRILSTSGKTLIGAAAVVGAGVVAGGLKVGIRYAVTKQAPTIDDVLNIIVPIPK